MTDRTELAVANIAAVSGIVCVAVAAWWLHPSCGLAVIGVALIAIGIGTYRNKAKQQ